MFKLILLLLVFAGQNAFATPPDTTALKADLQKVTSQANVAGSKVGIYAVDIQTGDVLMELNADALLNPASNTKLVTGAAALDVLGPEWTIFTRVSHDGTLEGDKITGNLWIKSDGDPFLHYAQMVAWAIDIKGQGVRKIEGDIVIDDTSFAPGYIPPAFDQKDEDASYRAPIGAVSVSFNSVSVEVHPGTVGQPGIVRLNPPNDYVKVTNQTRTRAGKGIGINARARANGDVTEIVVTGSIGVDAPGPGVVRKRIDHPSLFTGSVFKHALQETGIAVTGAVRLGERPNNTRTLVLFESSPMWSSVAAMNKWSNNFMAEMIFRLLGRDNGPANVERSREVVAEFMQRAGVTPGWTIFNGSGLYDGNLFSARQLTELLVHMGRHRFAPEFATSLAIAGRDGTLKTRLQAKETEANLRGKTGTLNEVTALAGYVTSQSGRRIAYTVIFNETPVRAWTLRPQQDAIVRLLANYSK